MLTLLSDLCSCLIYENNKKEMRVMDIKEILKFCDATLKRVLKKVKKFNLDVKHGDADPYLSREDVEYMMFYEDYIQECLRHCDQMRRWESYISVGKTSREDANYLLSARGTYFKGSRWDKEVNMAAGDSDDALLERFKLRSGKFRLADDKTLDIAGVKDVVLKTSFGTSWTLKDVRYILGLKEKGYSQLGSYDKKLHVIVGFFGPSSERLLKFGEAEESFLHNVSKDKETAEVGATSYRSRSCGRYNANLKVKCLKFDNGGEYSSWPIKFCVKNGIMMLKMVPETPLQFVSTAYLMYRIPYFPIGLRIPEEEWRGTDTSLAYLKAVAQMKCNTAFEIRRVTRLSEAEISHLAWVEFRNHSEPGRSLDMSEGSKNSRSFEDSGRSDKEYSEDEASCKEGGSEIPQKKAINEEMVSLEKNQMCCLVKISAGKKASQRLWMFKVKEEQKSRKRYKARLEPSYVGTLNDTSTHHKSEGFQLAGQEENLECRLKEILYGLIQALMLRKRLRILELNDRIFEDYYSEDQYAVSIKEDTAYPCLHSPKTTEE
ncbi:hypothetical protein Tco_0374961 [Tanacetum coccineum]